MPPLRIHQHPSRACAWVVPLLAQSPEAVSEATQRVLWSVAAIVAGIALVVIVGLVVRRLVLNSADEGAMRGFTLDEMRRLHERGELSDEEWAAARSALLAQGRRETADVPSPAASDAPGPVWSNADSPPPEQAQRPGNHEQRDPPDEPPPAPGLGPGHGADASEARHGRRSDSGDDADDQQDGPGVDRPGDGDQRDERDEREGGENGDEWDEHRPPRA